MAVFLVSTATEPTPCSHPRCSTIVPVGEAVYPARLREGVYCSSLCRNRDTRRLIQVSRREEVPHQRQYEREMKLQKKYGLTQQEWDDLYDKQLGRCAICLLPLAETTPMVDHNHTTGAVRGLLCRLCNPGLGYFRDDIERLQRAITYLMEDMASAPMSEDGEGVMDS